MTIHCAAVFEKGVLRPLEPLDAEEGEVVELFAPPHSWEDDLNVLLRERVAAAFSLSVKEASRDARAAVAEVRREKSDAT